MLCNTVGWNIEVFLDEYDATLCGIRLAPSEKILSVHLHDAGVDSDVDCRASRCALCQPTGQI